jgi:fatty-acyl-CoA synthase
VLLLLLLQAVVVDQELRESLKEELAQLRNEGITVYYWDEVSKHQLPLFPESRPDKALRGSVVERDPFLYIFTSGTTGMPKAGKISHTRFFLGGIPMSTFCYLRPGVRVYNALPLYHSAAGMLGAGGVLRTGATMVCRCVRSSGQVTA